MTANQGNGKRVIVFGGSGFLGSHVADALFEAGYAVSIFDSQPSRYLQPGQTMVVGDILDRKAVLTAVKGCRYVYNFAGIADLDDASTRPIETAEMNICGNLNILDAAVEAQAERFIYASSIYVYSEKGGFYRVSKQASELYIEEYQRSKGLPFTILRYGTLYGPRSTEKNSVHRYLKQALQEGRICYPGTGDEIREYVYVRDAAAMSVKILSAEFTNRHIIISGHQAIKSSEMINSINEILGNRLKITYEPTPYSAHYNVTPYSFSPKIGSKLTGNLTLDFGQGLLECLNEIHRATDQTCSEVK